jgi:hypothetical protein
MNWIAVACAEHARRGRALGIMQVCHGKGAPLRRVQAGDGVVYYSPTVTFRGSDKCQAFTLIGIVTDDRTYQGEMADGLGDGPFRRDVAWREATDAPIAPLRDRLELTRGKRNWGYAFRSGLVSISQADFDTIAAAMGA